MADVDSIAPILAGNQERKLSLVRQITEVAGNLDFAPMDRRPVDIATLDKTLQDFPSHSPHYALFLTFIKLFRVSQNHLNGFTDRHLKFYYKDILALKTNPSVRITARTLPENNFSTRILEKNNFTFTGEVNDPDDGEVWEWAYKAEPRF